MKHNQNNYIMKLFQAYFIFIYNILYLTYISIFYMYTVNSNTLMNPKQLSLVNSLRKNGILKSKEVEDVLISLDRGDFCINFPYHDRFSVAVLIFFYVNSAQSIGYNATISAPHMHVFALVHQNNYYQKIKQ